MAWLSKLLKASSSSARRKSIIRDDDDDDDSESLSSSRNSMKDQETESSRDIIVAEYGSNHHWHWQHQVEVGDHLAFHVAQSAGLSVESSPPPYYHHYDNNTYYLGNGFHHRGQGDGLDINWTDASWQTDYSGWIQNNSNQFDALQYEDGPHQYFGYSDRHPICDVCQEQIPVDSSGKLLMEEDRLWQLKYCRKHLKDGTPICFSCERVEAKGMRYSSHEGGGRICVDCKASVIMNIDDCQPVIQEMYEFYEGLNMRLYQLDIPIQMIDTKEMTRREASDTVGVTSYKESPSLYTRIRTSSSGTDNNGKKQKRFKLVSYREVINISLLMGQPRLSTGQTLAHEMMHAWLSIEGYIGPDTTEGFVGQVETLQLHEGLCQVMSHKWLESQVESLVLGSPQLEFERKLAQHYMRDIEERSDETYGGGFRIVNPAVLNYGLKGTLDYIRMTGKFPQ